MLGDVEQTPLGNLDRGGLAEGGHGLAQRHISAVGPGRDVVGPRLVAALGR
jgi:hypothetical protein